MISGNKWKRFKKLFAQTSLVVVAQKTDLPTFFGELCRPSPPPASPPPYAYAFGVIILFLTSLQSVLDAQWLAYQVQMYYASEGDRREEILKTFNVFPEKFDHMTVVKELNSEIESGVLTGSVEDKE